MDSELQQALTTFSLDVENADCNFKLAKVYERLRNSSSALTHYLRAAERTEDNLIAYECLIRASNCLAMQGHRGFTQSHLLKQAICLFPIRPEAYFFLCKFYEENDQKYDCYMLANVALAICEFTWTFLTPEYGYLGKDGLEFLKAVSGVHWEKDEESTKIFKKLLKESEFSHIREVSKSNLDFIRS